ncbi:MAG: acyl carrier protein [Oscillospiraceae bacterium]|jgi:acyl carrier protein
MVFEKLRQMISQQLDIDLERITEETDIYDDLGADSLDLVELLMMVEEQFNFPIDEEVVKDLHTVGDVVNYIEDNI